MSRFQDKVTFIWSVADLIKDYFGRGKYRDVILPLTVLRRIDCVLELKREAVRATNADLAKRGLQNRDPKLRTAAGFVFYNTSLYDFDRLAADNTHLAANLRNYIAGFSPNRQEIVQRFDFGNTISKLDDAGLLFKVIQRFTDIDLHPDRVPNHEMGSIFEELLRKFNEAIAQEAGQFFTPREVVRLMVDLMLGRDRAELSQAHVARSVCDPCCTGSISLQRGTATIDPQGPKDPGGGSGDEIEELSRILQTLNERFGTVFKEEDRVFIEELESRLDDAPALAGSLAVNPLDTVKMTFQNLVGDALQDMMEANFTLYQRVTDDEEFGRFFVATLFDRFLKRQGG